MTAPPPEPTRTAIEKVVRAEWGAVLARLTSSLGDFTLAEDALQDALLTALGRWPSGGVPNSPSAWLLTAARRKAIDRLRRAANFRSKRAEYAVLTDAGDLNEFERAGDGGMIVDERLKLIFMCCNPALAEAARVALTLKTVGGLATAEIARAFLIAEQTVAQRIVRAKRKIKAAGIPFALPGPEALPARLDSVMSVLYLIFNEGYAATSGDATVRVELCQEAIRLTQILHASMPAEAELEGLLALMLLHDARRPARAGPGLATLETQDRGLWNRSGIAEGTAHLKAALARKRIGPYQIQAAISAVHCEAECFAATDWNQIALLYATLYAVQPSPVVLLNGAVATSYAKDAQSGLDALDELTVSGALDDYQPYHAARADMLRRVGRREAAAAVYETAIALTRNAAEREHLRQASRLGSSPRASSTQ